MKRSDTLLPPVVLFHATAAFFICCPDKKPDLLLIPLNCLCDNTEVIVSLSTDGPDMKVGENAHCSGRRRQEIKGGGGEEEEANDEKAAKWESGESRKKRKQSRPSSMSNAKISWLQNSKE